MEIRTHDEKGALVVHDNRLSLVNNGVLIDRGYIEATSTTVPATATWTAINNTTITFDTLGGDVYIIVFGHAYFTTAASAEDFQARLNVDSGTYHSMSRVYDANAASAHIRVFGSTIKITGLSAGSHTVSLEGYVPIAFGSATISDSAERRTRIRVEEIVTEDILPEEMRLTIHTDNVSNPPTDAELDAILGTPSSAGISFETFIDDNGAGTNFYRIVSDGSNWWTSAYTKAT